MKKNIYHLIAFFIIAITLSGCTQRLFDFTFVSTKNVEISRAATFIKGNGRITGKHVVHIIIFIPTGQLDVKEAIDNAIERVPGCVALVDGVVYTKFWWFPYIYGQNVAIVEGTPLIDPLLALSSDEISPYIKMELGYNGEIVKVENITMNEFIEYKQSIAPKSKDYFFLNSTEAE